MINVRIRQSQIYVSASDGSDLEIKGYKPAVELPGGAVVADISCSVHSSISTLKPRGILNFICLLLKAPHVMRDDDMFVETPIQDSEIKQPFNDLLKVHRIRINVRYKTFSNGIEIKKIFKTERLLKMEILMSQIGICAAPFSPGPRAAAPSACTLIIHWHISSQNLHKKCTRNCKNQEVL